MTKTRRKHNSTVPNGRFLQSAEVERLLYGEAVPDMQRRENASAGAKEALSYIELGKAALAQQNLGVKGYSQLIDRVSAFAATELGVTFPASFQQWERMQVDQDTGEIIGGVYE